MPPGIRDVLCLSITLSVMCLPAVYLIRTWKWPPSARRSFFRSVAWAFLVSLPVVVGSMVVTHTLTEWFTALASCEGL